MVPTYDVGGRSAHVHLLLLLIPGAGAAPPAPIPPIGYDMVVRPCRVGGCSGFAQRNGYCEKHYRPRDKHGPTSRDRGYDYAWQRHIRPRKLRESPLCERCRAQGRAVRADLVHHRDRDPMNNAESNLESLCRGCHAREHAND